MKSINYEDMIMKRAMDVFAEEGLYFFDGGRYIYTHRISNYQ